MKWQTVYGICMAGIFVFFVYPLVQYGILTRPLAIPFIQPKSGYHGSCGREIFDQTGSNLFDIMSPVPDDKKLDRIQLLRIWARSIKDDCARLNYLDWLDDLQKDAEFKARKARIAATIPLPPSLAAKRRSARRRFRIAFILIAFLLGVTLPPIGSWLYDRLPSNVGPKTQSETNRVVEPHEVCVTHDGITVLCQESDGSTIPKTRMIPPDCDMNSAQPCTWYFQ